MEFVYTVSLVQNIPSILPVYLLRHSWHFRGFMLLRVYWLRVVFGCITFSTVFLVLKDTHMFVVLNSFLMFLMHLDIFV
jgi:hypothetical protein